MSTAVSSQTVPSPRAYVAFALGCAFFGYAFVQRVAPSVMVDDLMRDFAVGGAALGNLSAFYFYAYAGIQLPVGVLLDRFGPRRLLAVTALFCTAGSVLFAAADGIAMAAAGRALIGASVAFGYVGALTIAGHWFPPHRFALCVGLLQLVGMSGAVAGQAPMSILVDAVGWRDSLHVLAIVALLLAATVYLIVRDKAGTTSAKGAMFEGVGTVLKNPQTWILSLLGFALTAPMLAFAGLWAVPWLQADYGFTKEGAGLTASLLFIAWGATSPLAGWLTDRIGRRKPVLLGGLLLAAASMALIIHVPDLPRPALWLLIVLNGMGGCTMIIAYALVKELNPPKAAGAAMGIVNMCVVGSGAVMQPLIGTLLDIKWDGTMVNGARLYSPETFTFALSALLVTYAIGAVSLLLTHETHCTQLVKD